MEQESDTSRRTAFGPGGWVRRLARLWGFLGFALLLLVVARSVLIPFIFAALLAYLLAPLVDWLDEKINRGVAILLCYVVLIAVIASFFVILLPKLSKDAERIAKEAPGLIEKVDKEWTPEVAAWLENKFPSLKVNQEHLDELAEPGPELPVNTAMVLTPLPDGSYAAQLRPEGVSITKQEEGYWIRPNEEAPRARSIEERLRSYTRNLSGYLGGEVNNVFQFGRRIVTGVLGGLFSFFLVLMVCGFILIDLPKIHEFVRSLVPYGSRADYDSIVKSIDRGLSGVIRGQLLICLVNGVLTYIGLLIFDVKYSLILAAVAAIMSLIPIFGSILSTIPIVLAALVSGDDGVEIGKAVFMVGWISLIHFLEGNFLNPKIIGTAAKIHPVLVVFALIVGKYQYGLTGALLAVPAFAIIQAFFVFFREKAWKQNTLVEESG